MINEDYFQKIDCQEKAYFIGFIAADGYIHSNGYKLVFGLNIKDRELLEKFCYHTKCTNKICKYKTFDKRTKKYYYKASLQICSKKFVHSLKQYGLDNNKTKNYIIQNIPKKYIKDCIRGLMDGDGSIYKNGINLITTKENIEYIKLYLKDIKVNDYIEEIQKKKNVHKMYIYKDRERFLDHIYENSSIFLERKYKKYLETKDLIKNRTRIVRNREVIAYENDIEIGRYNSLLECAESLNIKACGISNVLAGRIKHTHGYFFVSGNLNKVERKKQ